MPIQTLSKLEQAISKYGGSDEAYKNKLKIGIRDSLGYSNYISRAGKQAAGPADIGDVKGLSPQGIMSRINSRFGMQKENIGTSLDIAGAMDTAAGGLAAEQVAREKAAASARKNAMGLDNKVLFETKDQLDEQILNYMQNPKNADGTIKTKDQFAQELNAYYSNPTYMQSSEKYVDEQGKPIPYQVHTAEEISKRLESRLPKDFSGNEDKYHLMAKGYSEKQATEYAGALRYSEMSTPEKLAWATEHPEMAKSMEEQEQNAEIIKQITATRKLESGNEVPVYSVSEIVENNPGIPEATIKKIALPIYRKSAIESLDQVMNSKSLNDEERDNIVVLKDYYIEGFGKKDEKIKGISGVIKSPEYAEIKNLLKLSSGDILTDADIDNIIIGYVTKIASNK